MAKLISTESGEGEVIILVPEPGEMITAVGVIDHAVSRVEGALQEALRMAKRVANDFHHTLAEASISEAELEFGVGLTTKGNVYIAQAEGQVSFKMKLRFTQR